MVVDDDKIISIKQLLVNSIKNDNFDYIYKLINKNVNDCNLLYTQVCYLIKLFLLYDFEINKNKYNDYKFDELFIRKCFKLIKTGNIDIKNNNTYSLLNRIVKFYNEYNLNQLNHFKFIKPDNVLSITHITDSLSRDIQTNITNNIIINYYKYLKEFVHINLKLNFNNIDYNQIIKIYNDILNNTFISDQIYHNWIKENKKLIIPNFDKNIIINNFKDGIDNHFNIFVKYINKYVKENQDLLNLISINNDNKNKIIKTIINNLISNDINEDLNYNNWIIENKNIIINEFNSTFKVDIDKELEKNPYLFLPYMLFINLNLELNKSKKKFQIIPIRTNLTPKFIPINIDSLVDILDSKFLLGNIKNYYHNANKKGLILFDTYFNFNSKFIKNTIKQGYIFSGLIYTNGYEINYIYYSNSYNDKKNKIHLKAKNEIKYIKENTFNLNDIDKELFIKKYNEDKDKIKKEKLELNKEKNKKIKQIEKDNLNKILINIENELTKIKKEYEFNLLKIEEKHYSDLKLELDLIDKTKKENKKLMQDIMDKYNNIFISKNIYLEHEYNRNYSSLINDYNNNIDINYKLIKDKETKNNELINKNKNESKLLKDELKIIKKENFNKIILNNKKEKKKINSDINENKLNKKTINRIVNKIKNKLDLLDYELTDNKLIIKTHIEAIKKILIKLLIRLKEFSLLNLNKYLNEFENINNYLLTKSTNETKIIINMSLKYLSIDIFNLNNENMNNIIKLLNLNFNKIKKIELEKNNDYKLKYQNKIKELNINFSKLNKLMNEKRKIEKEKMIIFQGKNNENLKVDDMSKKTLTILNKMNWVVIDPGINSLLTMLSNDGKTKFTYSKSNYLSKIKRKETLLKIEKIKKGKITKLENTLTKEKLRLKSSNNYKTFNEFVTLKMKIHNELVNLYNDPKLNKLKWYSFINEKRSQTDLINKIKKTFINETNKNKDLVLLLGDWSMNKKGIKTISTPNKKYEKLLSKNILTLKINEFRTSIIDNKTELKCENLKIKKDYKKLGIKEIYSLEKLKEKNELKYKNKLNEKIHKILTCKTSEKLNKYLNRDINAVKNMKKIVLNYLTINKKPMIFVMGLLRKSFIYIKDFLERLKFVSNKFKRRPKICNNDNIII